MVKRYEMNVQQRGGMVFEQMKETHDGDYVNHADYVALEAERDRLREVLVKVLSIGDYMPAEDAEVIRQQARTALGGESDE